MPTIRVYPTNGAAGMYNRNNAVSAQQYYSNQLNNQKKLSSLQLGYERKLAGERIKTVRLEERLRANPYGNIGGVNPYAGGFGAAPFGGMPFGGIPTTGVPFGGMPMGGIPGGFPGSGQANITNQTSTGGNQSVANSNHYSVMNTTNPMFGASPFGGFGGFGGGGGFFSSLLGALI